MHRFLLLGALAPFLMLGGCAPHPAVKPANTITLTLDQAGKPVADVDQERVYDALAMIQAGQIQKAIDGPLAEVIAKYEAMYKDKPVKVFCARGMVDALTYAALSDKTADAKAGAPVSVIGPTWALAYWARGYALAEMGRYGDARAELEKALALSPMDSQYKSELAFTYQRSHDWKTMLSLYQAAEADADISAEPEHVSTLKCAALRGQGYALVELHRLEEATRAYQGCLKLIPGEPKSVAELGYIRGLEKSAGAN